MYIIALLIIYVVGGLATRALPAWSDKSIVPFYSWFFFVDVPEYVQQSALIIHEYDGEQLEGPILFQNALGIVDNPRSAKARELIQRLRKSLDDGDVETSRMLRKQLEDNFLPLCLGYRIATIAYNPIERWKHGTYEVLFEEEFNTSCE